LLLTKKTDGNIFPLTPYYFWPVSEAWEQIRFELDSKPWVKEEERVRMLNLVVDTMTNWQKARPLTQEVLDTDEKASSLQKIRVAGIS